MIGASSPYRWMKLANRAGVLEVTLNRPDSLNAITPAMHAELVRLWSEIATDEETRVVLLTGEGRAFCAGADMKGPPRSGEEKLASLERQRQLVAAMMNLDKPIVSAVRGAAIGSGLALALMADIVVVARDARLSDANVRLGVASGDHAVWTWPLLCGMAKAKHLLLTGKMFSGEEAERIGLASLAVPAEEVDSVAGEIAAELAQGHQDAIRWTKRALNGWLRLGQPAYDASVAYAMLGMLAGSNEKEGGKSKERTRASA
jgi:enoyl-CoA hydratase